MKRLQYSILFLTLIILSISGLVSCNEKDKFDVQENYSREKAIKEAPKTDPKVLLEPELMEAFLPKQLTNSEKYPWSGGFSSDDFQTWSTVATDYVFDNRGFAHAAIFDYGPGGYNDDEEMIHQMPEIPGHIVTRIKNSYGPGYLAWIPDLRKGRIAFLAADRYVIKIEIDKLPDYIKNPEEIFNKYDLAGLVRAGDNRVNELNKK